MLQLENFKQFVNFSIQSDITWYSTYLTLSEIIDLNPINYKKVLTITDRKQAIKTACQMANPNDIILIAGKGHETYQEIKGERFDFDDFKIVQEFLKQLQK